MRFLLPTVAVATLACAAHAHASDSHNGGAGAEMGAPDAIKLKLTGDLPQRCGFRTPPTSTLSLGDLERDGAAPAPMVIDCNTGFRVRIVSQNGALRAEHPSTVFGNALAYDVRFEAETDVGRLDERCGSAALKTGGCKLYGAGPGMGGVSSGKGVAINKPATLTVEWKAPGAILTAGTYSDLLTIVVEARS
jgi:hypothetical protein